MTEDGDVQVWNTENGNLLRTYQLGCCITSMCSSPTIHLIVVGTNTGHVIFIDATPGVENVVL